MGRELIAGLDAAGLPGPAWLFRFLLVLTFFLHLLFMNLALGGTLLAWIAHVRAGGRADGPQGVLAGRMMAVNSFTISLTITTGVAPLLFIQLLHQPLFYSGTILLGWIWFALPALLIVGYYAAYLYKFRGAPARGRGGGAALGLSALGFLAIAMIHVGVHLVHVQPDRWPAFAESPWRVLADPTYWPRLLHFVLAGLAFAGLVAAWWAARCAAAGERVEVNVAIARSGWRWALTATALLLVDGFVLLLVLPGEVMTGLMRGGPATLAPLTAAIALGVGLLVMLARSIDPVAKRGLLTGTLAATTLAIAVMSVTRDQVRTLYLAPLEGGDVPAVVPQWGNFALFAVLLVLALWTVGFMVRRAITEPASP